MFKIFCASSYISLKKTEVTECFQSSNKYIGVSHPRAICAKSVVCTLASTAYMYSNSYIYYRIAGNVHGTNFSQISWLA